jgi:imidazolonepropionase-like amidohydrolase
MGLPPWKSMIVWVAFIQGKTANLIITKKIPSLDYMVYAFGTDHISKVILKGQTVYSK